MLCRFFTSRAFSRPCRTPPSRAAPVPHSAMTLHVVTPLPHLSHLRSAAMGLPYGSEPGRFPQWHRLEAVLEGAETEKLQKRSDFCFCGRWIAAAGQIPQRVDRRSGGGSRKGRVAAAGQIIQRAGSARSGVSVRIHFATRFAYDDDTVCVTECAPFWLAPTLWG